MAFDNSEVSSISISKENIYEEQTAMSQASWEDALSREEKSISNEHIQKGNRILETYTVMDDAIPGGMGNVWRVHHESWNTDLAMKRPKPEFFAEGGKKKKQKFIEECDNWIKLGLHPNIVSCFYVREIGGVPTIFSEWMNGGSLGDRIKDGSLYEGNKKTVQERILTIAIQTVKGLQYSHEKNLIHQDVKPDNLLLTKDWNAKVADFGLASVKSNLEGTSGNAKTTGYTLAYCPEEQIKHEEPARWMDVYAWALTVFEMYAGKRLWETGASAKEKFEEYTEQCAHKIPNSMILLLNSCLKDKPGSFNDIKYRLFDIFREETGSEYPEDDLTDLSDSAENLNNRALSFLDLKQVNEAEKCWEMALAQNPDHTESVFNSILCKWYYDRFGLGKTYIVDAVAIMKLKSNNHNDIYSVMVMLYVSILRCNREDAVAYLETLESLGMDKNDSANFKALIDEKCREPKLLRHFGENERPLIASKNGDVAVLDETMGYVRVVSLKSNKYNGVFRYSNNGSIEFGVFNEEGNILALCGKSGITVWDIREQKILLQDTDSEVLYAVFDEQKHQIAVCQGDWRVNNCFIYSLYDEKKALKIEKCDTDKMPDYKIHPFFERDGIQFMSILGDESIVDCFLDDEGHPQYTYYPGYFRKHNNCGVYFRKQDTEMLISTWLPGNASVSIYADMISRETDDGYDVYQISIPDVSLLPHMELSKIHSVEEQYKEKKDYLTYIQEAEKWVNEEDYPRALKRIDAILSLKKYEHDRRALELRSIVDTHMTKADKTFLRIIERRDFEEVLPLASCGTYPEAPKEIYDRAMNCIDTEDFQEDYSGNLMVSLIAKVLNNNQYPIQRVYCTSNKHVFVCCGWKHERKMVGYSPADDEIIEDSTSYRISLYNDDEKKMKSFPPFSSTFIRGAYLSGMTFKYNMYVAYSEEYHRLIAGNEDRDTPRVTWDTEMQTQISAVNMETSVILLLSNPRYYLAANPATIYIVDLKDNAIVWTDTMDPGKYIKYEGNNRFDRERDIFQFELIDGSYLTGQVLWSYDTGGDTPEKEQVVSEKTKDTSKEKTTVDATIYSDDTKNFIIENNVLVEYIGTQTQLIVPDGVSEIADGVFKNNEQLISVKLPESVTKVGEYAFEKCTSLKDVNIPTNMNSIGKSAFAGCGSLTKIVMPDSVTYLGERAFEECSMLSSVRLPEGLTEISERLFKECMSLRSISIPENVAIIGREAFKNCIGFRRIVIPDNVTVIQESAFEGCILMDAIEEISDNLEIIGDSAFRSCYSLSWISLWPGVKCIGKQAFRDCAALDEISLPNTVKILGEEAYYGCRNMESITIPESVTEIGDKAFVGTKEGIVIKGQKGSAADLYAQRKGYDIKYLSEPDSTSSLIESDSETKNQTALPQNMDTNSLQADAKYTKGRLFSKLFGRRK